MKILCPVKKSVWGPITNRKELEYAIAKSGQPFGVDMSGPACDVNANWPCDKTYYEYLGFGLHKGIDIPTASGTEIYSATDGTVCEVSDKATQGLGVVIYDDIQKCKTIYWHLKSFSVRVGDKIRRGQLIAISDNTGYSLGPHLHFELKTTDEHGVSIENIDPLSAEIIFNIINNMTWQEVKLIYILAFYREPNEGELNYWAGKPLEEFLKIAIKDRGEFLINELK